MVTKMHREFHANIRLILGGTKEGFCLFAFCLFACFYSISSISFLKSEL